MDVEPPTSDAPLRLSTELLPEHEGGVQAVAALSDDLIVSGGDDSQVFVWHREGPGAKTFMAVAQIDDHKKAVRAIFPLPPCTGLPTGGFATGSLDNNVRLYSVETSPDGGVRVALVRTLEGHMRGVISLSLTSLGELVSGGWEGHVRVWDIASGACRFTLEGHENGTCVVGLPNGDIATGSTGRKSEDNRHVDYKLRLWRMSGSGNLRGYSLYKTIEDHEQAVRDVALLPDAQGWVSVGNDGSVRVRNLDGSVRSTFVNPVSAEGKPHSAFRVCVARALGGAGPHAAGPFVVTANEDDTVRVVDLATGDIYGLKHPGQPWGLCALPCGDLVTSGNQGGTSGRGHVYVWSADPARRADEATMETFVTDCTPPAKGATAGGDGSGAGAAGGAGLPEGMELTGPYEARSSFPGASDGAFGFFTTPDGGVMVCSWSSAAGAWVDVGTLTEGPNAGGDGGGGASGGAGAASASSSSSGGKAPGASSSGVGPDGRPWDYALGVTMDTATGMRSLQLCFNSGDDPNTVAANFCSANGIGDADSFEEVRNFILQQKARRGDTGAPAGAGPAVPTKSYRHFPSSAYLTLDTVDWKRAAPKLAELNAAQLASGDGLGLDASEMGAVNGLIAVLGDTSRWHASEAPRAAVRALFSKALRWPVERVFAPLDVLKVSLCHPDGAAAVAEVAGAALVPGELSRIAALRSRGDKEARAAVMLSARCLFNALRHSPTRALVLAHASAVLDCVSDLLNHDAAVVRHAGSVLLQNVAHAVAAQAAAAKGQASSSSSPTGSPSSASSHAPLDPGVVDHILGLVVEGFQVLKPASPAAAGDPAEDATLKILTALGTLVLGVGPSVARTARALELEDTLSELPSRFPASVPVREAVADLAPLIKAP